MRADQPLAENPVPANLAAKYPDSAWDPDLLALMILPEFLTLTAGGIPWFQTINLPARPPITQQMVDQMLELAVTERPEALGEIVQQHVNFQVCWLQLLMITRNSHPQTFLLMKLAARVGEVAMMYFKRQTVPDNRHAARPSQICPTLFPPVSVQGHSSYPAGHAIIGTLTSLCLADVVPAHAVALQLLADRVGRNRVIAGLHFQIDIDAGASVAVQLHGLIGQCPLYQQTLVAAKAEW
jgi:acid phosphatase (class A)